MARITLAEAVLKFVGDQSGLRAELDKSEKIADQGARRIGDVINKRISDAATKAGKALSVGLTAPLAAIATASLLVAGRMDEAFSIIRRQTGATGREMQALREDFRAVFRDTPKAASEVAQALAQVHTRLGLTGESLRKTTAALLDFAETAEVDAGEATRSVTRLLNAMGLSADRVPEILDKLTAASQRSGISAARLAELITTAGPSFQALGFDINEVIALLAQLEKAGADPEQVVQGLNILFRNFAKGGVKDAAAAFNGFLTALKNAPTLVAATGLANDVFGRSALGIAKAVRNGAFEVDGFAAALTRSQGVLQRTQDESRTFAERITILGHRLDEAFAPLGTTLQRIVEQNLPALERFISRLTDLANAFANLPQGAQTTVLALAGIAAALGPALLIFAAVIRSVEKIIDVGAKAGPFLLRLAGFIGRLAPPAAIATFALTAFASQAEKLRTINTALSAGLSPKLLPAGFANDARLLEQAFTIAQNFLKIQQDVDALLSRRSVSSPAERFTAEERSQVRTATPKPPKREIPFTGIDTGGVNEALQQALRIHDTLNIRLARDAQAQIDDLERINRAFSKNAKDRAEIEERIERLRETIRDKRFRDATEDIANSRRFIQEELIGREATFDEIVAAYGRLFAKVNALRTRDAEEEKQKAALITEIQREAMQKIFELRRDLRNENETLALDELEARRRAVEREAEDRRRSLTEAVRLGQEAAAKLVRIEEEKRQALDRVDRTRGGSPDERAAAAEILRTSAARQAATASQVQAGRSAADALIEIERNKNLKIEEIDRERARNQAQLAVDLADLGRAAGVATVQQTIDVRKAEADLLAAQEARLRASGRESEANQLLLRRLGILRDIREIERDASARDPLFAAGRIQIARDSLEELGTIRVRNNKLIDAEIAQLRIIAANEGDREKNAVTAAEAADARLSRLRAEAAIDDRILEKARLRVDNEKAVLDLIQLQQSLGLASTGEVDAARRRALEALQAQLATARSLNATQAELVPILQQILALQTDVIRGDIVLSFRQAIAEVRAQTIDWLQVSRQFFSDLTQGFRNALQSAATEGKGILDVLLDLGRALFNAVFGQITTILAQQLQQRVAGFLAGIIPGLAGGSPLAGDAALAAAGVSLSGAGVSLGTAGVSLGTAGVSLGTAGVSLGTAGVTLGTSGIGLSAAAAALTAAAAALSASGSSDLIAGLFGGGMQHGGLVTRPLLTQIGEAGRELVQPIPTGLNLRELGETVRALAAGGTGAVTVQINNPVVRSDDDIRRIGRSVADAMRMARRGNHPAFRERR